MTTSTSTSYDQVLYPNFTYPQTHPRRLAALAKLLGMAPTPIEHCRVLELGCGDGGNIVPMAFALPQSQFVGIDLASIPIAAGNLRIAQLGLPNIRLEVGDLGEIGREIGEFDYIICHGIYSWVPAAVRANILAICRQCLAPQGVAYISYNTYPGFHLRALARDLMRFHTRNLPDAKSRVNQSRTLIKWLADAQPKSSEKSAYQKCLQEVDTRFKQKTDGAIFHDDLADTNYPLYFHQFIGEAAQQGLQYLTEAEFSDTQDHDFAVEVQEQLLQLGAEDILAKEQYLDFLKGRSFRQTLLCHHNVKLERVLAPNILRVFYLQAQLQLADETISLAAGINEQFTNVKGQAITTDVPLAKAALRHLAAIYPQAIGFNNLLALATSRCSQEDAATTDAIEAATLAELVLQTFAMGLLDLQIAPATFSMVPGEFPQASALARAQARDGVMITSAFHHNVRLEDDLSRQLLILLDGTRNRSALIAIFNELLRADPEGAEDAVAQAARRHFLAELPIEIEQQLHNLGRLGLLIH